MQNKKVMALMIALGLLIGGAGVLAIQTHAQSNSSAVQTNIQSGDQNGPDNVNYGHRPLGGDGVVSSISGTTIVMSEESDEGGASYTIDASSATVTNNGVTAQLSDIKVGDKIFVEGTVNGTNVKATSISLGHPGDKNEAGKDANENETNDNGVSESEAD
jgi:hypothetical protein